MSSLSVEEAQAQLPQLIDRLQSGDEVVITRNSKPVARLTAPIGLPESPRRLGTLQGTVLHMAPDFDAPLDDFREYTG